MPLVSDCRHFVAMSFFLIAADADSKMPPISRDKFFSATVYGHSNGFEVKAGKHQGSALSPLLFVIVMEALSREFRVALPWEFCMQMRVAR